MRVKPYKPRMPTLPKLSEYWIVEWFNARCIMLLVCGVERRWLRCGTEISLPYNDVKPIQRVKI